MLEIESKELDNRIEIEALDQVFNRIRKEVLTNMLVPLVVILVMWSQVDHSLLLTTQLPVTSYQLPATSYQYSSTSKKSFPALAPPFKE